MVPSGAISSHLEAKVAPGGAIWTHLEAKVVPTEGILRSLGVFHCFSCLEQSNLGPKRLRVAKDRENPPKPPTQI